MWVHMGVLMYAHYGLCSTLRKVGPHIPYHVNMSTIRINVYDISCAGIMTLCRNDNGRRRGCYAVTHTPLLFGLTMKF